VYIHVPLSNVVVMVLSRFAYFSVARGAQPRVYPSFRDRDRVFGLHANIADDNDSVLHCVIEAVSLHLLVASVIHELSASQIFAFPVFHGAVERPTPLIGAWT
jgi:hypothetical protein